jgi:hypothetical protein
LGIHESSTKELALGYRWLDGKWIPQPLEHDGVYGAMGGLITTMEDYGKYVAFHQAAWPTSDAPEVGILKGVRYEKCKNLGSLITSTPTTNINQEKMCDGKCIWIRFTYLC